MELRVARRGADWLFASAVVLAGGCSGEIAEEVGRQHQAVLDEMAAVRVETVQGFDVAASRVRIEQGVWLGPGAIEVRRGDPFPLRLAGRDFALYVAAGEPSSKALLIDAVSDLLAVPVSIDPVSLRLARGERAPVVAGVEGAPSAEAFSSDPRIEEERADLREFLRAGYRSGSLNDDFLHETGGAAVLLDRVARVLGFEGWIYERGYVLLRIHESRDFPFHALAGVKSDNLWAEAEAGIRDLCGDCEVLVSREFGLFKVVARPIMLGRVEEFVANLNRIVTDQIVVDFELFSVQRDTEDGFRFDLNLLFAGEGALRAGTGDLAQVGQTVGDVGDVLESYIPSAGTLAGGLSAGFAIVSPGSLLYGSNALIQALAKVGKTSIAHSTSFPVLNGREQSVEIVRRDRIKIAEKVVVTNVGQGQTTTDETIEEFQDGLVLTIKPRLIDDGVVLQYTVEITTILSPTAGEDRSELSVRSSVETRKLSNEVIVPLGSRVVFNAFDRVRASSKRSGTGDPDFWFFGGSRSDIAVTESLIISLKPVLANFTRVNGDFSASVN